MAGTAKPKSAKRTEAAPQAAAKKPALPYTGKEFLESLDDGREVWIYGGLLIKATEITGARSFRGVEANIGEVIAWRNMIRGLSDAMAKSADPWTGGCILPGMERPRRI